MAIEIPPYHTTLSADDRGRVNLRKYLHVDEEYRVHLFEDGSVMLRPVRIEERS